MPSERLKWQVNQLFKLESQVPSRYEAAKFDHSYEVESMKRVLVRDIVSRRDHLIGNKNAAPLQLQGVTRAIKFLRSLSNTEFA